MDTFARTATLTLALALGCAPMTQCGESARSRHVLGLTRGFSEGLAPVRVGGKYGYIDKAGTVVINPQYQWAGAFSEGLAALNIAGAWGFVNRQGSMASTAKFDGSV